MERLWFFVKGIIALASIAFGIFLDSCNRVEQNETPTNAISDYDSVAYIISKKRMKTLQIIGEKIIVLEQDGSIHVHKTKD